MHIKSFNFLSGSLQQELQKFRQDQGFSQAYSNLDKEFRTERVAVQYQDPKATMNNGFVENLDFNQEMIEDKIKGKDGNIKDGNIKSSVNEAQNNELSVYERLLKGNVAIQLDSAILKTDINDMEVSKTVNSSMNAVMNVLGDDNFSQKMKNDSSNWAQVQSERVNRVEDELQTRHKSRSDREYSRNSDSRYGLSDRSEEQRRSNDALGERKNQVSRREQSHNDYNRRSLVKDDSSQRNDLADRNEDLQNVKNLEKERTTKYDLEERLQSREDKIRTKGEIHERAGLSNNALDQDLDRSSIGFQRSKKLKSAQVDVESSSNEISQKGISNEKNLQNIRKNEGFEGKQFIQNETRDIEKSISQLLGKDSRLQSINGNDMVTDMASLLFSNTTFVSQSNVKGIPNVVMNDTSGLNITELEIMSLSDIKEIVSEQDSILDDNTLISTVLELQEELLELSDNLYLGDDPSSMNAPTALLINAPHTHSAKMSLLQQIQNMAKPLGSVMKGLHLLHQKTNISMMDDFILDMKWDTSNANMNKNARSGTAIQSLFSNSTQSQLQNEVQNVVEQGLKASALTETTVRGSDFMSGSVLPDEQSSTQISSIMGMSLEGGQTEGSQQDISTLLQNIDSKQLKELQSTTSKKMFSKMVRVIERLMEQYKPPFDPNVLKQLEIRVQDPAGVIILDIAQDKSQILVKAIIPDSIHHEFSQTKGDIESSLSEHGLELGSWEMTKQSEQDDSQRTGNFSMNGQGDFQEATEDSSTEGSTNQESDRLISKNI